MIFILQGIAGRLADDPAVSYSRRPDPATVAHRPAGIDSVRVTQVRDRHCRNRAEEQYVKYAMMGISFILFIWAGTFYLML